MKRNTKQFLSLFLSATVALSLVATPVNAAPEEPIDPGQENVEESTLVPEDNPDNSEQDNKEEKEPEGVEGEAPQAGIAGENTEETENPEEPAVDHENTDKGATESGDFTISVQDSLATFTLDASKIDVPEVNVNEREEAKDVEIDESDPEISVVKDELENIKVLNEDGNSVALTEEQIQTVLGMFQLYTNQWKENADILGVQTPFYLLFNDNGEDGLGVLGEMLTLAGVSVDDVRTGNYSYDDLCGMIMNFQYGDKYGIQFYGDTIREKRDEALAAVEKSGAKTDVQKLLVLNDWLAQTSTFDMAYIMNQMGDEPVMAASSPKEHPHYKEVYDGMYAVYEPQIRAQFHDQFYTIVEGQARQTAYENAIKEIVAQTHSTENPDATEEEINAYTEQYIAEHKEEITADAYAFVKTNFGEETADGIKSQIDAAFESDETKEQLEAATAQIMDMPMDEMGGISPNEAIPGYVDMAAKGLTEGIIGYWSGNHMGALAEGKAVCMGYAKAYAYLVQCMYPEYYGVNGAGTDMTVAANWKQPKDLYYDEEGNLDVNQNYNVDLVRITFQADVTMYGESQPDFNSDHFWNAVKIDGEWYYVDPCYTDVWTEVMDRDRVETDGYINHLYFMMSHTSAATMFDGNYKIIKGLYNDVSDNKQYEDSWVSRIASNTYSDGEYFYYLYDSTDLLSMLEDFNNSNGDYGDLASETAEYKLVRHKITDSDVGDGDSDYETLIEFNYQPSEDADTTVTRVLDPASGEMKENEMLTELYEQFVVDQSTYPSLHITPVLYGGKIYFNLSNAILSYDLASGEVTEVKEYNTVHAVRDDSVVFGGMAFSAADSAEGADFTFENHPLAGMTLKSDGQLYVSVATNLAYISGKDPHNYADSSKYGWEFEESNYNQNYQSYAQDAIKDEGISDDMLEQMGYKLETNDNDEFMWVANVVETMDMTHFAGESHSYSEVSVEPFCGRDGYKENRCTVCGAIEKGSRAIEKDSALDKHHYVKFDEEYYTKDESENWNTGTSYVCTECGFAISEPSEPKKNSQQTDEEYEESLKRYEKLKAIYDEAVKTAGHVYDATNAQWSDDGLSVTFSELVCAYACAERKNSLDCLVNDGSISVVLSEPLTAKAEVTKAVGTCAEGVTSTYTASGEVENHKYAISTTRTWPAGEHEFVDGKCIKCGELEAPALTAPEIESVYSKKQTTVKVTWNKVDNAVGYQLWRAESPDAAEEDWTLVKTVNSSNIDQYTKDGKLQYTNVELEVGKTYYYKLRAFALKDGAQDENDEMSRIYSAYSEIDYMPATVVLGDIYSAAPNKIRLNWKEVKGANGYQIWRKTGDGSYSIVKTLGDKNNDLTDDQGKTTAYSNVDLKAGETYTYKIRAFRIPGDGTKIFGAYSNEFTTVTMPDTTTLKGTSKKAGEVELSWNKVNGAAGYQIWMSADNGEYKIVKTIEKGSITSYAKKDLKSGSSYKFKIRAYTESNGKKTFGADSKEISVKVK